MPQIYQLSLSLSIFLSIYIHNVRINKSFFTTFKYIGGRYVSEIILQNEYKWKYIEHQMIKNMCRI